jgi:adenylate cyclase
MSRTSLARRHYCTVIVVLTALVAVGASLVVGDRMNPVDGFFYDLSLAATKARPGTTGEPVAVIALDRASLASDALAPLPRAFLSPVWAQLLDGLVQAGASAVGFDIIFAYSANRLPGSDGQYDKGFLTALVQARDRVVLARSPQASPALPFVAAVLDPGADAELTGDPDGIVRWMRATIDTAGGQSVPAFAASVLARAKAPQMPPHWLLAPRAALEAIPTYRIIDVLHCLDRDPAALRQAFAGKIVLIGTNLPEEDRKRAPDRFMPPVAERSGKPGGCGLDRLGASDPGSGTTPGVLVHAAAIEAAMTGDIVHPLPWPARAAVAALFAVAGSLLGLALRPWIAAIGLGALGGGGFIAALVALGFGWWFALVVPFGAATVAMIVAYIARFLLEERRRRRVQGAFSHYLAPAIVDQLAENQDGLHLGGELREVTVMFADLSGFTALSGKVGPSELMTVTNAYLGLIVEAVEANGGYVDKFIGDAVMGVWGAPAPNADHAGAAARAALQAVDAVLQAKKRADASGEHGYSLKIGLNSGPAVVGNVGAPRRFNYTAVGETVNIAARLEGVPGDYGCRIIVGPATAEAVADRFLLCELDWIKVKGKAEAIAIYELIGTKADASATQLAYVEQYHAALDRYRAGDFAAAETCWRKQTRDPLLDLVGASPPWVMAERCAALQAVPEEEAWDGIFVKTTK